EVPDGSGLPPVPKAFSCDWLLIQDGQVVFLEAGPPHTPTGGAHPCCFAVLGENADHDPDAGCSAQSPEQSFTSIRTGRTSSINISGGQLASMELCGACGYGLMRSQRSWLCKELYPGRLPKR